MVLPCNRTKLQNLTEKEIREAILERRRVIRESRDARGDDRCWLDYYLVWGMLDGTPPVPPVEYLLAGEGMRQCALFYCFRRLESKDPTPKDAILDPGRWDEDLLGMTVGQLRDELIRIQAFIRRHRDISGRPRTVEDDKMLYSVLPEKIPADFRLPPEEGFLGNAQLHAGCPAFWDSHAACDHSCNLHQWGPCR